MAVAGDDASESNGRLLVGGLRSLEGRRAGADSRRPRYTETGVAERIDLGDAAQGAHSGRVGAPLDTSGERLSDRLAARGVSTSDTYEPECYVIVMRGSVHSATFGGGCFWCVEAAFEELDGVEAVTSGYAGGHVENPSYEAVCSGETGHAEVVRVEYDADAIGYDELLEVFFAVHDPTQLDRQGPDVGTQYRSIVLYHDDEQREQAEAYVEALDGAYDDDVVTEIEPLEEFYEAEEYHQDYFEKNPNDAYCRFHTRPKVEKVREKFRGKVKSQS